MSNFITFIITTLVEAWETDGTKFGPTMIRWVLKVELNKVMGEFGWKGKKVRAELVKRQPQLKDSKILDIEECNLEIA